jgi:hypothetical protein
MSKTSDALFDEIKNHITGIETSINQLGALDLTENEKGNVQHIRTCLQGFNAVEVLQPRREPSAEQARLDAEIVRSQRVSYS